MNDHEECLLRPAATLEEMRAEINRLRFYHVVVQRAMEIADYKGYSGEDRYTLLSYSLLTSLENTQRALRDLSVRWPMQIPVTLPEDDDDEPLDYRDEPSLTAAERNPSL